MPLTKLAALFTIAVVVACAAPSTITVTPEWAFVVVPPGGSRVHDDGKAVRVPNSAVALTRTQIATIGGTVPDWHPDEHPAMPEIVGRGRSPQVLACGYCHLANGAGRPENTSLAGLPPGYLIQQIKAFRNGERSGSEPKRFPQTLMISLAKNLTDTEITAAATYFASLKPVTFVRVVESTTVPRTVVAGWVRARAPDGGQEPLGERIIEMPVDFQRFENRDSRTRYIAYVPVGSVAKGAELVATGGQGRTQPCAVCHGDGLKGKADVPRLAGRSPSFLMRQLCDVRNGTRTGGASALMKPLVALLTESEMLAIVAYVASLEP